MKRTMILWLFIGMISSGCASSTASDCVEYAAEVRFETEHAENAGDLMRWLEDTSEHAATLIRADPDRAQPCADAIIEATFSAGLMEFESELDLLLDQ